VSSPSFILGFDRSFVLDLHGQSAVFSELSYQYPLKLLSPRVHHPAVAIAYILTYGGGLVSGDHIRLDVHVCSGASLLLLTQGSTKVFKHRLGARALKRRRPATANVSSSLPTTQRLDVSVQQDGVLLLLPDPVTCFSNAAYNQLQSFHLERGASAVILDWITSGRMSRGEEWQFTRYYSVNEVWLGKKRVARDVLLLEEQTTNSEVLPQRTLKDRMAMFACYATVLLIGPKVNAIGAVLSTAYRALSIYQRVSPERMVWSLGEIEGGWVVRVAAKETETVREWLREQLVGLSELVGADVYSKAFV